ncbi:MAG: peptidoglycan-binding domain-containing protein [Candidatus Omnitrophota bacterium]|jgi:murein L,D-transpeptidase YcbB/YkuD
MVKKAIVFSMALSGLFLLNGCATTHKSADLESQGLRNQVGVLEAQLQAKDQEISSLRDALRRVTEENSSSKVTFVETVSLKVMRPTMKQIQVALKNAGFDPGRIDGRKGKQTKEAIKSFQRGNNLKADGAAGKKTWELLSKYLYQNEK